MAAGAPRVLCLVDVCSLGVPCVGDAAAATAAAAESAKPPHASLVSEALMRLLLSLGLHMDFALRVFDSRPHVACDPDIFRHLSPRPFQVWNRGARNAPANRSHPQDDEQSITRQAGW